MHTCVSSHWVRIEAVACNSCAGNHKESSSGSVPDWNLSSRTIFYKTIIKSVIDLSETETNNKTNNQPKCILTFNPVTANEISLLFLLSSDCFNGKKHVDLNSWDGLRSKLCWEHNRSKILKLKMLKLLSLTSTIKLGFSVLFFRNCQNKPCHQRWKILKIKLFEIIKISFCTSRIIVLYVYLSGSLTCYFVLLWWR